MPAAHMRKKHASLSRYNTGQLIGDPPKHLLNCGWPPNCSLCVSQMLTSGGGLPAAQVTCTLSCSNYPLGMDVSKKDLIVLRLQLGLQQSNSHVWMALCWFMQVLICWIFLQLVFLGLHFYDVLHVLLVPKGEEQRKFVISSCPNSYEDERPKWKNKPLDIIADAPRDASSDNVSDYFLEM